MEQTTNQLIAEFEKVLGPARAGLTLSYFENLVAGAVRVKQSADIKLIALICFEAHKRGENAGAWHSAAKFYGYPERCNCVPCTKARAA